MKKDRIKELREKNGLTKAAFAKSLGISPTSVSLYESGKQIPGQKIIAKICEVYGVDEAFFTSSGPLTTPATLTAPDTSVKYTAATPVEIKSSKPAVDSPTKSVADKGEKKPGRKAEKKESERNVDKTAVLARVAEIGVRKAAEEAGVAWQTVTKWKKDAEKAAAKSKTAEVENDLPTLKAIQDMMEKIADNLEEAVEEIAEDFEKAIEGKNTPEEIEEAITEVIEKNTSSKEEKKQTGRKAKEAVDTTVSEMKAKAGKVDIIIQSPMGGAITPEQIAEKVPEGAEAVYVRVDENKLYYVLENGETGDADIWC